MHLLMLGLIEVEASSNNKDKIIEQAKEDIEAILEEMFIQDEYIIVDKPIITKPWFRR